MVNSKIQRIYLAVAGAGPDQSSVRPSGRNREREKAAKEKFREILKNKEENKTENFQFDAVVRVSSYSVFSVRRAHTSHL